MPLRPLGTYFWLLWCLSGFLFFILREFGFYNLYGQTWIGPAPLTWSDFFSNGVTTWLKYPREVQITSVVSLFWAIAFRLIGLGVFLGLGWGRKYLIWASIGYFVWRIIEASFGFIFLPLYTLTAIFFISWYFRRGNVREYFGVEVDDSPAWVKTRLGGKLPLDLAIALALMVAILIFEVQGLFFLLDRFS